MLEARTRPADRGDTRFLVWVMQEAARSHLPLGIWDAAIPDPERRVEYLDAIGYTEPRSFCHWSWFRVAEVDGRHAGALAGYEPRLAAGAVMQEASIAAMQKLGWSPAEMRDFGERLGICARVFPALPDDRFVIEFVATAPEFRGRGIVNTLLLETLDHGRELGYRGAQIGYLIGNERARRAYLRVGFRDVDEKRDRDFEALLGSPGITRMHRDL